MADQATSPEKEEGVSEEKTTAELKSEVNREVQSVPEEDDYGLEDTVPPMQTLSELQGSKLKHPIPPPELRCPICGKLMGDPVVISSGQTYDRACIQKLLNDGHRICPQSKQELSHTILTHNRVLKEIIAKWGKKHGIELPSTPQDVDGDTKRISVEGHLSSLLEKLSSSSLSDKKMAAKEIRQLTKTSSDFRARFGEVTDAIAQLIEPLSSGIADTDPDLEKNLITAMLNIFLHGSNNRKLVAENPKAIPIIIKALKSVSDETRSNAAAALSSLSDLDSNKDIIVRSGALKPLIELLEEGHPLAMRDAASAIHKLCNVAGNKRKAVAEGAVFVMMDKIRNDLLIDELLCILAMLSRNQRAIDEMAELGAVSLFLGIIRENSNDCIKENCISILYALCDRDQRKYSEIKEEEDATGTISQLAQSGTPRAQDQASSILGRIYRYSEYTSGSKLS